jgi:acyl transferase domain-containing protein
MAEFVLLAVSPGSSAIADLLGPTQDAVRVAISNCPHQTVLAGLPAAMSLVERELSARGIVCDRLPFSRPYHTPLFEPFLAPVARMYETLGVRSPRTPIYSCITGCLFPENPEAIRRLSVEHWARPVEFARMIENMYADGVRLFVECGPRGNLTSFV